VGTTEVEVESASNDAAVASAEEIDYLLSEVAAVWPAARGVAPIATLAGLRPLPARARSAASASRRHEIAATFGRGASPPCFTILGGKLTTHRREGEEAARAVARALGRGDGGAGEPTRGRLLPGMQCDPGPTFDARALGARAGIAAEAARRLLAHWGCRAWAIAASMAGEAPIPDTAGLYPAEVRFAIEHEGALGLDDVLMRRTQVWQSPSLTASGLAAAALVWADATRSPDANGEATRARATAESERVQAIFRTQHHRQL
jgi:glycerol-3-phosphate dehydrogenase